MFVRTLVLFVLAALPAVAMADINTDKTGLAIAGYDPVAYHTQNKAVPGNFKITAEHETAVYRFANEANRELFKKNPAKYVPEFGGYCAYGVGLGAKFTADPTVFQLKDGKLYLNLNPEISKEFNKDLTGTLAKAHNTWKTLEAKPAR